MLLLIASILHSEEVPKVNLACNHRLLKHLPLGDAELPLIDRVHDLVVVGVHLRVAVEQTAVEVDERRVVRLAHFSLYYI